MPIVSDYESVEGVSMGVGHGTLTLAETQEAAVKLRAQVGGPRARLLWDLRDAHFNLSADEVHELADAVKHLPTARDFRIAYVVARDLEFGLVRMFETLRETDDVQTSVFRDKEKAIAWLTDEPIARP